MKNYLFAYKDVANKRYFFSMPFYFDGKRFCQDDVEGFTILVFQVPQEIKPITGLEDGMIEDYDDLRIYLKDLEEIDNPDIKFNPNLWAKLTRLLSDFKHETVEHVIKYLKERNLSEANRTWLSRFFSTIPGYTDWGRKIRYLLYKELGCSSHGRKFCREKHCVLRPCGNSECYCTTNIGEQLAYGFGEETHGFPEHGCKVCARFFEEQGGLLIGTYWPL